jgi:FkbM family methyltransferase
MNTRNRLFGLLRSLAIYHAVPLRQRRLRALYGQFVSPNDLVFDLGAHAGNHTRALAAIGCRVVALEPQPDFARLLRAVFAKVPRVEILESAVAATAGHATLSISDRTPTMTTLAVEWRDARAQQSLFSGVRWDRPISVETTTLDALITRFGVPAFVKIDVEGAEPSVLSGLSYPLPALSFEYLPDAIGYADLCVQRLAEHGRYRYNWSSGETYRLAGDRWMNATELFAALNTPEARRRSGDIYARLDPPTD